MTDIEAGEEFVKLFYKTAPPDTSSAEEFLQCAEECFAILFMDGEKELFFMQEILSVIDRPDLGFSGKVQEELQNDANSKMEMILKNQQLFKENWERVLFGFLERYCKNEIDIYVRSYCARPENLEFKIKKDDEEAIAKMFKGDMKKFYNYKLEFQDWVESDSIAKLFKPIPDHNLVKAFRERRQRLCGKSVTEMLGYLMNRPSVFEFGYVDFDPLREFRKTWIEVKADFGGWMIETFPSTFDRFLNPKEDSEDDDDDDDQDSEDDDGDQDSEDDADEGEIIPAKRGPGSAAAENPPSPKKVRLDIDE